MRVGSRFSQERQTPLSGDNLMNSKLAQMRYPPAIETNDPVEKACLERIEGGSVTYKIENALTTKMESNLF
jgi:hypothetical protein